LDSHIFGHWFAVWNKKKISKNSSFFFGILNALHSWLASGFLGVFFYDFSIRL